MRTQLVSDLCLSQTSNELNRRDSHSAVFEKLKLAVIDHCTTNHQWLHKAEESLVSNCTNHILIRWFFIRKLPILEALINEVEYRSSVTTERNHSYMIALSVLNYSF